MRKSICSRVGCTDWVGYSGTGLCQKHYWQTPEGNAWRKEYRKRAKVAKTCEWCGQEYRTDHRESRGCTPTHGRWVAKYGPPSPSRELTLAPRPVAPRKERPPVAAGQNVTRTWVAIVQGACDDCGSPFAARATTLHPQGIPRRCADCGKGKRGWITKKRRAAIYARDNYLCQICGLPVTINGPWETGAALDHIVPQSMGGTHRNSNLRTTHNLCNSIRREGAETDPRVMSRTLPRIMNKLMRGANGTTPPTATDAPLQGTSATHS